MVNEPGPWKLAAESCRVAAWARAGGRDGVALLALADAVEFLRMSEAVADADVPQSVGAA